MVTARPLLLRSNSKDGAEDYRQQHGYSNADGQPDDELVALRQAAAATATAAVL